ncbi:hypothetical protein JOD43_001746 [Pullulanibacillus pueri]|uniref:SA1362 family protein n=1 Tax=Pullulanibacillus pueri TaxID=1437324 RepID=UPI001668E7AE|nr:SA1362 family protein [Pullulanibacillus pueri]MBM7681579.1 hypothetical protein [Pullulanibacillus pueri]
MKKSWTIIFYLILSFGAIGLLSMLISNPVSLVKNLLIIAVVAGVIYFIYRLYLRKSPKDYARYRRAVKQTKKRAKDKERSPSRPAHLQVIQSQSVRKTTPVTKSHKRATNHLTVIDGKKRRRKKLFFLE